MQRVMIVGQPGSGKSTLARQIGARVGLPVVHIDLIHWQDGWVERTREEKTRLCNEVEARDAWVFEGGHSATWPNRMARADHLIWLDLPLPLRLWRVIARNVRGWGKSRPDLPEGCPERLDMLPGFLKFVWTTRNSSRDRGAELMASAPPTCRVIRLNSKAEIADFLRALPVAHKN
jgi:adenylate kinase family enzyme